MNHTKYTNLALKCQEEVKKELSKADWWFNRINKQKAIKLLTDASTYYYFAKNYIDSLDTNLQALELSISLNLLDANSYNLIQTYLELSNKILKPINNRILEFVNNKLIPYLEELKAHKLIINILNEIAVNYELFGNKELALNYYNRSLENSKLYDCSPIEKVKLLKKIAEINLSLKKNEISSEKYRECAEISINNYLLKFGVKSYLLYSLILLLDILSEEQINSKVSEYTNKIPLFSNSPEYNLINELIKAYKDKNINFFNQVIKLNRDNFDKAIFEILENIKNNF